eukprot:tig00020684_g12847.t1
MMLLVAFAHLASGASTLYALRTSGSLRFDITFAPHPDVTRFSIYPRYVGAWPEGSVRGDPAIASFYALTVAGVPGGSGRKTFQLDNMPIGLYNFSASDARISFLAGPQIVLWTPEDCAATRLPCTSAGVTYPSGAAISEPPENGVAISLQATRQGPNSQTVLQPALASGSGTTSTGGGSSNPGPPGSIRGDLLPVAVGAGLGGLAVLIAAIILAWVLLRRSRRARATAPDDPPGPKPVDRHLDSSAPNPGAFMAMHPASSLPLSALAERSGFPSSVCVACGGGGGPLPPDENAESAACAACRVPLAVQRRFYPLARVGGGEFGTVFLAVDLHSPSSKRCLVKKFSYFSRNSNDHLIAKAAELFLEEGRVLEQLAHPRIPKLLGSFQWRGDLFHVMDFVPGRDLQRALRESSGPFPEAEVLRLLDDLLGALEYVHATRVLHRDVKPSNIIAGDDGYYYLVDFGLSATVRPDWQQATQIGTYAYADPEQRRGYPTESSDLFSLAATCVELLTRALPTSEYFVDWRPTAQLSIGAPLAGALERMLARAPAARFESAAAARRALAPALERLGPRAPNPKALLGPLSSNADSSSQVLVEELSGELAFRAGGDPTSSAPIYILPSASGSAPGAPAPPRGAAEGWGPAPAKARLAQS